MTAADLPPTDQSGRSERRRCPRCGGPAGVRYRLPGLTPGFRGPLCRHDFHTPSAHVEIARFDRPQGADRD